MERGNGGERTKSKCKKDKNHDLWYGPGSPTEFRQVFMCCLSHWSEQQQHLLQLLQALGAQEISGLKRSTKDSDFRCTLCHETACTLWGGRPQREVQVGPDKLEMVTSFCNLGDMLSAAGDCDLQTTTCSRSCYQFSLPAIFLSRHVAACTALVCIAQCSMPVRLGH